MNRQQWSSIKEFILTSSKLDDPFIIPQNFFKNQFGLEEEFYDELCELAIKEKTFSVTKKYYSNEYIPSGMFLEFRRYKEI